MIECILILLPFIVFLVILYLREDKGHPEDIFSYREYLFKYYILEDSSKSIDDYPLTFLRNWKIDNIEEERVYILPLVLEGKVNVRDYLLDNVWKSYNGKVVTIEVYEKIYHDIGSEMGSYTTMVMIAKYKKPE